VVEVVLVVVPPTTKDVVEMVVTTVDVGVVAIQEHAREITGLARPFRTMQMD